MNQTPPFSYFFTMEPQTKDIPSLIEFVKELNEDTLEPLIKELEQKPKKFSVYYDRPKEDWEKLSRELTGLSTAGSDIHTFLHTREEGINYY